MLHKYSRQGYTFFTYLPFILCKRVKLKTHRHYLLLLNFLIFGLPFWLLFNYGYFSTFDRNIMGEARFWSIYLASIWIFLGPLLICYWETHYRKFIVSLLRRPTPKEKIVNQNIIDIIFLHQKYAHYFGSILMLITIMFFWISIEEIQPFTTVFNNAPLLFITIITLMFLGFASGYGISGVVQAIYFYIKLEKFDLNWLPFHPDERGGHSFLGDFSFVTWVAFSGGMVVIPATFAIAYMIEDIYIYIVYATVAVYAFLNTCIFIFPLLYVAETAKKQKQWYIEKVYKRINNVLRKDLFEESLDKLQQNENDRNNIDFLISTQERIYNTPVYPISYVKLWRISTLSIMPVLGILFDLFIKPQVFP